jgi:hypothetical protein
MLSFGFRNEPVRSSPTENLALGVGTIVGDDLLDGIREFFTNACRRLPLEQ